MLKFKRRLLAQRKIRMWNERSDVKKSSSHALPEMVSNACLRRIMRDHRSGSVLISRNTEIEPNINIIPRSWEGSLKNWQLGAGDWQLALQNNGYRTLGLKDYLLILSSLHAVAFFLEERGRSSGTSGYRNLGLKDYLVIPSPPWQRGVKETQAREKNFVWGLRTVT